MTSSIVEAVYPEQRLFGFTRVDGTLHFHLRVQALLTTAQSVLDVGCGRGQRVDDPCKFRREYLGLRGVGRRVIGIDVNPAAAGNPFIDEFRLIADVQRWPVETGWIDLIHSDYVLEHVDDPAAFFAEANRVLKPGGYIALRTPNFFGYSAVAAWLVPNRLHAKVLSRLKPDCKSEDVFPTVYRCNTRRKLQRALATQGFDAVVYAIEGEPGHLERVPFLYRVGAVLHAHLPSVFKSTLLAFARKRAN